MNLFMKMTELKDWLNSINFNKDDLTSEDPDCIKEYPSYIVNRCLSGHLDTHDKDQCPYPMQHDLLKD